jgi:hypothetical protein
VDLIAAGLTVVARESGAPAWAWAAEQPDPYYAVAKYLGNGAPVTRQRRSIVKSLVLKTIGGAASLRESFPSGIVEPWLRDFAPAVTDWAARLARSARGGRFELPGGISISMAGVERLGQISQRAVEAVVAHHINSGIERIDSIKCSIVAMVHDSVMVEQEIGETMGIRFHPFQSRVRVGSVWGQLQ